MPFAEGSAVATKLGAAVRDARVLGPHALLRLLYEAGKRSGALGLAFRLIGALPGTRTMSPAMSTRVPEQGGQSAVRAVKAAERIVGGSIEVFGRDVSWPAVPDWHTTVEGERRWPETDWWRIDVRSESRIADVKWTWEVGRHAHLVLLARAAAMTTEEHVLRSLEQQLSSWLDQNPPETGVHWYSNLEIALRAIAWAQVLELMGDRLDPSIRVRMASTLQHSGRHLLVELPYTFSSMRNNHLLGDAVGIVLLGSMFRTRREGRVLAAIGDWIIRRQLPHQVCADGSMLEDSVSYHRFVLEMLAARVLMPGDVDHVQSALVRAGQFLFRLGVAEGPVPQYGDWDEGRILATSGDRRDVLGSARLALALGGTGSPQEWREDHDEIAWYAPVGGPVQPEPAEDTGHDIGGGIARVVAGSLCVWLKAGSRPSHGHADLCSVAIALDGDWVLGDPGTGTYNGPVQQRNYFRSSIAHNVIRLDGLDQLVPHRAFRWLHRAEGVIGPPLQTGAGVLMWGAHNAYRRLEPSRRVARTVLVSSGLVVVADWVEGFTSDYALSIPLPASAEWNAGRILLPGGAAVRLALPGSSIPHRGEDAPYDGWWSTTYGQQEPATRLEVRGHAAGPVVWTLMLDDQSRPGEVRERRLAIGEDEVEVEWGEEGALMRHRAVGGDEQLAFLRLL